MTRHFWTKRQLDSFVDEQLAVDLADRVQLHLDECAGCRAEVGELLGLKAALAQRLRRPADIDAVAKLTAWALRELPSHSA